MNLYEGKFLTAELSNVNEIYEIEKESFLHPWEKKQFINEIEKDNSETLLIMKDDEILGFIIFWTIIDEIHIIDLAVREKYKRQGIAKRLIKEVIKKHKKDCKCVWLEVRSSNVVALKLYESLNFHNILTRKKYYENEDAFILMKPLCGINSIG